MTPWHFGKLVALDFETTGVNPEEARIVQVGGAMIDGVNVKPFDHLVNPLMAIPEGATEIHGITDEMVQRKGLSGQETGEKLLVLLEAAWAAEMPVVIYNAPYDLTVIDRELARWGMVGLDYDDLPPIVDPLCLINGATAWKRSHSLEKACEVYKIPLAKAHSAPDDAFASARLAWRLAETIKVVIQARDRGQEHGARMTVEEAHDLSPKVMPLKDVPLDWLQRAQRRWYENSADGFVENQRSKGREPENVNRQWPVIRQPRLVKAEA